MAENGDTTLSARGLHFYRNPNLVQKYTAAISDNLYHPTDNPQGVIKMGLAEHYLCEDLWLKRMNEDDMNVFTADMLYYFEYYGDIKFKAAICQFLTKYLQPAETMDPKNMVITSGAGAAMDMIATCIADAGDCFLNLAPGYTGLKSDFSSRAQTKLVDVHLDHNVFSDCSNKDDVEKTIAKLENAIQRLRAQGETVQGIVLVNPHNPIGYIMPLEFVDAVLQFAYRHDIHVIMDEIYAMTVFDDSATFRSILQLEHIPRKDKTHFIWGFSKDFTMAGVRCGVVYTWNAEIRACAEQLMYFGSVPPVIQHKLKTFISDLGWLEMFFEINHRRLKESYSYSAAQLDKLEIPYIKPKAAFFIWTDLSQCLPDGSTDKDREMALFRQLLDAGLYFFPGQFQGSEHPGWFRITFAMSQPVLEEAFNRLGNFLKSQKTEHSS